MDPPKVTVPKPREVQFEIRTTQDIAIWDSKFNYESGSHESSKEEFMNHLYLKSYMEKEASLFTSGSIQILIVNPTGARSHRNHHRQGNGLEAGK